MILCFRHSSEDIIKILIRLELKDVGIGQSEASRERVCNFVEEERTQKKKCG